MKIVVDNKIPYIQESLKKISDIIPCTFVALPGAKITAEDVQDADILVVRTRTHCNEALLGKSAVKLLLTAAIGYDHFDTQWLNQSSIEWHNCPGCNATSVAQYVECALLLAEADKLIQLKEATLGIVGVGHVGTAVANAMEPYVKEILLNDIRPEQCPTRGKFSAASLEEIAEKANIITFHTPLTREGEALTWHLADTAFFHRLLQCPIIINAARGGVVDEEALLYAHHTHNIRAMIIDTWETEPNPQLRLLKETYIGTPHIAGYSADGKLNATRTCLQHIIRFLQIDESQLPEDFYYKLPSVEHTTHSPLTLYNPSVDSEALKCFPDCFEFFRGHYCMRREGKSNARTI